MQDPILKRMFANSGMIELLARRYSLELASDTDFSTLRELSNELVSDQLDKRFPDMLFVADSRRGRRRKVLFHLEFQARPDAEMALRCLLYAGLAAQKLRRKSRELRRPGALVVVSMVLYHGKDQWKTPVAVEDLVPGVTKQVYVRPEAVDPERLREEDIPPLVLGLFVPDQENTVLRRRLAGIGRAMGPDCDPELGEHIGPEPGDCVRFHV